ncbi:methylenetetrahydrofolate reductase [Novosphingobium sp. SG720]|uniref:methylenetetrahydrofolate reductase n=1 Tax=Novosphingobium sp. SG720 TaxID=2586998 RepID=UPI0032C09A69
MPILNGYSLEMTAKERPGLDLAASEIEPGTQIAVAFLPNEDMAGRIAAARHIRELGFEPMPHISARRIASNAELFGMVERCAREASVKRVFLVAGDPPQPAGPFEDTLSMLRTGVFEANEIEVVSVAGHPEGHPVMAAKQLADFMDRKLAEISARGMESALVTQFSFDHLALLDWLTCVRRRGINVPVRLGVPGPAGIRRLLRYAAFCGVGSSATVLRKYGISLGQLIGTAGPDRLVAGLEQGLADTAHPAAIHFYPFGGLDATVRWIASYRTKRTLPQGARK